MGTPEYEPPMGYPPLMGYAPLIGYAPLMGYPGTGYPTGGLIILGYGTAGAAPT